MAMTVFVRKARSAMIRLRRNVVSARFGASPDQVYRDAFYDGGGFAATDNTAAVIVPYVLERFAPSSVLDLGCGMGNYLSLFADAGCRVFGLEGSAAGLNRISSRVFAMQYDLRLPLNINQTFDLVMSIEVAEHIPRRYSRNLVRSLCKHSNGLVLFAAAPPGTPGDDHINCRDRRFWDHLFSEHGYRFDQRESEQLSELATKAGVARWFQEWAYFYTLTGRK